MTRAVWQADPMPRSNRPRRPRRPDGRGRGSGRGTGLDPGRLLHGRAHTEHHRDGEWLIRQVAPNAATKTYRCPGCDQEIQPGVGHVVAWPAEPAIGAFGGVQDRRHWHRPCWAARRRSR